MLYYHDVDDSNIVILFVIILEYSNVIEDGTHSFFFNYIKSLYYYDDDALGRYSNTDIVRILMMAILSLFD